MTEHKAKKRPLEVLDSETKYSKKQKLHKEGGQTISKQSLTRGQELSLQLKTNRKVHKKFKKGKKIKLRSLDLLGKEDLKDKVESVLKKNNSNKKTKIDGHSKQQKFSDTDIKAYTFKEHGGKDVTNQQANNEKKKKKKKKKRKTTSSLSLEVKQEEPVKKIQLPQSPEEYSSNWKKLQLVLQDEKLSRDLKETKKKPYLGKKSNFKGKPFPKADTIGPKEKKGREPDIWFDDVDHVLIDSLKGQKGDTRDEEPIHSSHDKDRNPLIKQGSYEGLSKIVSMDCEMVGVGIDGKESMLARVSIVNQYGHQIFDQYVQPMEDVIDYRTRYSGIRKGDLTKGKDFFAVQKEVAKILKGRILVGHAIQNDLKVLFLDHPRKDIRDTSKYKPFRRLFSGKTPALRKLSAQVLNVSVQEGEHNSVQDAQAAMRLYTMYRQQWEKDIKLSKPRRTKKKKAK